MTDDGEIASERTVALAGTMLAEVRDELDRADQKASLLVGSLGIAFSIVLGAVIGGDWSPGALGPVAGWCWALGVALAVGAVLSAALAIWPRLTKPPADGAIAFWGHITDSESPAQLAADLAARGIHDPDRTFQQLLVLSAVVRRKYLWLRTSMLLAAAAALAVVVAFVVTW